MIRLVSTYPLFSPLFTYLPFGRSRLSRVLRAVKRVFYETDQMSLSYKLSNIDPSVLLNPKDGDALS